MARKRESKSLHIDDTPSKIEQLALMQRLDLYAQGKATWIEGGCPLGESAKQACRNLYVSLVRFVNELVAPLLSRVASREMGTFTIHDSSHGMKVAHLMWHILQPERQNLLTSAEIGLMIGSAFLHDLGMLLSDEERALRLAADSDLWDLLEYDEDLRAEFENLQRQCIDPDLSTTQQALARRRLMQAEEALLCQDTRSRHAVPERYREIIDTLIALNRRDPVKIPDIESLLTFDGDSFLDVLIDICVSHGEEADALVKNNQYHMQPRFPSGYPVGCCKADLQLVAAALRLADILDFDRERTPPALFYYLFPGRLGRLENRAVLEWNKHLAISSWNIDQDAVVFRGRCKSHIIHHAIVQFCMLISDEIKHTSATFESAPEPFSSLFRLPLEVRAEIREEGYHYVPYHFQLDDERIYKLLMGRSIYREPLVAVRELIQNAVDACVLRDRWTRSIDPSYQPSVDQRIIVRYEEPTQDSHYPCLIVQDTGTGMDKWIIEHFFLTVGRSYYASADFTRTRVQLRKNGYDFAPVSEFGIGFLSCFLLADRVEVTTAMWEPVRQDTHKRVLQIDGPTRLMRLDEYPNEGLERFRGTRIKLFLSQSVEQSQNHYMTLFRIHPFWVDIKRYLQDVCQNLPYNLNLEYVEGQHIERSVIRPIPMEVQVPAHLEPFTLRIPLDDNEKGIEGEIALINPYQIEKLRKKDAPQEEMIRSHVIKVWQGDVSSYRGNERPIDNVLLRGGFAVGSVPGLPISEDRYTKTDNPDLRHASGARVRLTWEANRNRRFLITDLARTTLPGSNFIGQVIQHRWLSYLLENISDLPEGFLYKLHLKGEYSHYSDLAWLEKYNALTLYSFARRSWLESCQKTADRSNFIGWENGNLSSIPEDVFNIENDYSSNNYLYLTFF